MSPWTAVRGVSFRPSLPLISANRSRSASRRTSSGKRSRRRATTPPSMSTRADLPAVPLWSSLSQVSTALKSAATSARVAVCRRRMYEVAIGIPGIAVTTVARRPSNSTASTTRGITSTTLRGATCRIASSARSSASTARAATSVVGTLTARTDRPLIGETSSTVTFAFGSFEMPITSDCSPEPRANSESGSQLARLSRGLRRRGGQDRRGQSRLPTTSLPGATTRMRRQGLNARSRTTAASITGVKNPRGGATSIVLTKTRTAAGASSTR